MSVKNNLGRTYFPGKGLSEDYKRLVIDELELNHHGNKETTFVNRGAFTEVSHKMKLSYNTVSKVWREYWLRPS